MDRGRQVPASVLFQPYIRMELKFVDRHFGKAVQHKGLLLYTHRIVQLSPVQQNGIRGKCLMENLQSGYRSASLQHPLS